MAPRISAEKQLQFEMLTKAYMDAVKRLDDKDIKVRLTIVAISLPPNAFEEGWQPSPDELTEIQIAANIPGGASAKTLISAAESLATEGGRARPLHGDSGSAGEAN